MFNETNSPVPTSVIKSIAYWALFILFLILTGLFLKPLFPAKWEQYVHGGFGTFFALLATWILLKNEKKSFADYGLTWQRDTVWKFLKGMAIGTAIFIVIIVILVSFSELQIRGNDKSWDPVAVFWYLSYIPLALMEEIAFRAYPFLKLNRVFGLRITQFIVALVFAFYHIIQGWDIQIAFLGPAIWALVFGLAAIWSNGIALPTGIHVALNLIQQLTGIKSGAYASIWVLEHEENAPAEAIALADTVGLATQILVLISALFLTEYYLRKKQN